MAVEDFPSVPLFSGDRTVVAAPLTITPETLVVEAIAQMDEAHASYAIVVDQQRPVGYFTERELIRLIASKQPIAGTSIISMMTPEISLLTETEAADVAYILQQLQQSASRLAVVDSEGTLLGVITVESIVRALNAAKIQQTFADLQQQIEQLLAENQALLESRDRELAARTAELPQGIDEDIAERLSFDRLKDEFISVVSHELRTPLTAIHGGIQLLLQHHASRQSEQGQALLQVVAQSSQRLVRLVNDILDIEYLAADRNTLSLQPLHTQDLTRQVKETFRLIANAKNIELVVQDPGLEIGGNRDRLSQVLTNLIDNAVKFSPANSTIHLAVERCNTAVDATTAAASPGSGAAAVRFAVCDQGRGIPAGQRSKIFERFSQVDASSTRQEGGNGLGLAICRSIVEQHGGRIWVESTVDEGSCFYFTIPAG
ncbi:MAG: ATP-binding protein [Phormidesmis sp.]